MSKKEFQEKLKKLVEVFERNKEVYKDRKSDFNEAQLREQFLNPMFKALGWDMSNEEGRAEQYKEVVHEDKVLIKGKPKAPDYSFRIGGQRKFFLEAKQPFVKIKSDYDPALQLRRYAWSADLPISILTDFEEFAVYDTTVEPKATDKASVARLEYFTFDEYIDNADKIYELFAKESILKGSFDKYANKKKRGKQLVDKVFLKELEKWRELLAKDLAKNNPDLTVEELNYSVQKLIDRLIFLRIAEDRGIESYESLKNIIKNEDSYPELVRYFKRSQKKYNSSLFDFEEDTITPTLKVKDKVLDKILSQLYYPQSPYEFSVLGVELLGSIYEQFLGKVIRLTAGHNAKIEEKPEVKKAGGVYYTPQYIVQYIVENTVGELIKGKTPRQVKKIKVLDPACGSGSFLIGAYEYLLDWHLDYYLEQDDKTKEKLEKKGEIFKLETEDPTGDNVVSWQLTTEKKKEIMLNNIYGVDIDRQAVEVTKLSLALKMLENENQETINKQMKLFPDRILPDLDSNIKCGNSLVGSDYWDDKDLSEVSEEEIKEVNAFDWEEEFEGIIGNGGFDAVIGNPPYFNIETLENKSIKTYLKENYSSFSGKGDILYLFYELGIRNLREDGLISYITSRYFIEATYAKNLREYIISNTKILKFVDFTDFYVFEGVGVHTLILELKKKTSKKRKSHKSSGIAVKSSKESVNSMEDLTFTKVSLDFSAKTWSVANEDALSIKTKVEEVKLKLKDIAIIEQGQKTGRNSVFRIDKDIAKRLESGILKKLIKNSHIKRYYIDYKEKYLIYTNEETNIDKFPKTKSYLENYKEDLKSRAEARDDLYPWWRLQRPRREELFEAEEKIVVPYRAKSNNFALDTDQYFNDGGDIRIIVLKDDSKFSTKAVLGVLNSKLMSFYFNLIGRKKGEMLEFFKSSLQKIPIAETNDNYKTYVKLENLVTKNIKLYKSFHNTKEGSKRDLISRQIQSIDSDIDELVYKMYELTKEEIDIIEAIS